MSEHINMEPIQVTQKVEKKHLTILTRSSGKQNDIQDKKYQIRYPADLQKVRAMKIDAIQVDAWQLVKIATGVGKDESLAKLLSDKSDKVFTWFLPIPNHFNESFNQSWQDTDSIGVSMLRSIVPTENATKAASALGYALNTTTYRSYTKPEIRTFTLEYNFAPQNFKDAKALQEVINTLRGFASPTMVASGTTFQQPHLFKITFDNTDSWLSKTLHLNLFTINSVNTDFSPGGNMNLIDNEIPKSINITINIAEYTQTLGTTFLKESEVIREESKHRRKDVTEDPNK